VAERLAQRPALVTGAASGIGRAAACELARQGARVACVDLDLDRAEQTAKSIAREGGEAFALRADITRPDENARMVRAVEERYGPLRIAYLNAGVASAAPVLELAVEEWDRVCAVNLRGVFLGIQAVGRAMRATGGGAIVVTASTAGLLGAHESSAYCASKHGVLGLVKSAAADLAAHGIRVNAVCPGMVDTPLLGPLHGDCEKLVAVFGRYAPQNRVGQPEEIARVVAFLASDDASYVTGAGWPVDGGQSATVEKPSADAIGSSLDEMLRKRS
jgi:NAD(P)-dependent dehydrogenase (short-subunit alcohol dehydrogenase family)